MSKKKRINIICYNCNEEFSVYKEPKGVLLIECPFCGVEQKMEFEDNSEKMIYKGKKVNKQ